MENTALFTFTGSHDCKTSLLTLAIHRTWSHLEARSLCLGTMTPILSKDGGVAICLLMDSVFVAIFAVELFMELFVRFADLLISLIHR